MRIANPIYDAVIKFLLEDNEIAKEFISILIGETIVSLELKPQELIVPIEDGLSVMRIDFKAFIRTKDRKRKKALIEIQKSRSGFKLSRFRQYLGANYLHEDEIFDYLGNVKKSDLPITVIYILGFQINTIKTAALKVDRTYRDLISQQTIPRHKYLEGLSHDCLMIQIPRLKMKVETELEQVLDVFNEQKYGTDNRFLLERADESEDTHPLVKRMLKRLNMATMNEDVLRQVLFEQEMERNDEKIANADKTIEQYRKGAEESRKREEEARRKEEEALVLLEIERTAKEQFENEIVQLKKQLEALKSNDIQDNQ